LWRLDEVDEAVKFKKALYRNWLKEKSKVSLEKYRESKRCAKKTTSLVKENKQRETVSDLNNYENENHIL